MKKVSIITLCWNQLESATKPFVESLYKYTNSELFELIIINNASDDSTFEYLEKLKQEKDNIILIHNEQNLGYSKGNNQGMKIAKGDYLFMLNNDILFMPNWLENMVEILDKNPQIGVLAPKTHISAQPLQLIENPENYTKENYMEIFNNRQPDISEISYCDKVIFFCWAMRREVLEKVGFLDENFGLAWYEDDDYTLRVLYQGYKPAIANNVFLFHNHYQGTSVKFHLTDEGKKLFERNRKYFEDKHSFYLQLKKENEILEKKLRIRKNFFKNLFYPFLEKRLFATEKKVIRILGVKISY